MHLPSEVQKTLMAMTTGERASLIDVPGLKKIVDVYNDARIYEMGGGGGGKARGGGGGGGTTRCCATGTCDNISF